MKVQIVANKLSDTDNETGQRHRCDKDDVVTVSESYGRKLCACGWAKDVTEYDEESRRTPSAAFKPGARNLSRQLAGHMDADEVARHLPSTDAGRVQGKDGVIQPHSARHAAK